MTARRPAGATVRAALAALLCAAGVAAGARDDGTANLMRSGEAALSRGDVAAAVNAFERAGAMRHAADAEMGLVRAHMQAGEYRQALGLAAHVAGDHRDAPGAAALHAWLLAVGGHAAQASRALDDAQAIAPGDALLVETRARLASPAPVASGVLLATPHRTAPPTLMAQGQPPPDEGARVVANGVLLDPRLALAPAGALGAPGASAALWVRNGLGETTRAVIERRIEPIGLAVLRLATGLSLHGGIAPTPRDAFAGSPGFAVTYRWAPGSAAPAWPWLLDGFLGSADGTSGARRLGMPVPAGAAVFDAAGHLAGIAIEARGGTARWLPMSALRDALGMEVSAIAGPGADAAPATRAGLVPSDEVYGRALGVALQVIAVAH